MTFVKAKIILHSSIWIVSTKCKAFLTSERGIKNKSRRERQWFAAMWNRGTV